mmetsp:Transcript_3641/g.12761  ORF Transcript_3641/g.12761 Transcript_3641/m.12761 type:complete len:243 (-) Transcript_3641:1475-2203(-)
MSCVITMIHNCDEDSLNHAPARTLEAAVKVQPPGVVLPHPGPVGDRQEADPRVHEDLVQLLLTVRAHRARALVQYGVLWLVAQQPCHGNPLLLPARQGLLPVDLGVQVVTLQQVPELNLGQRILEVPVPQKRAVLGGHLGEVLVPPARPCDQLLRWMRIKKLVPEGAADEVWALTQEKDLVVAGSGDLSLGVGPQSGQAADQRGLARAVRTGDQHRVLLVPELHVEVLDEGCAVRGANGNAL